MRAWLLTCGLAALAFSLIACGGGGEAGAEPPVTRDEALALLVREHVMSDAETAALFDPEDRAEICWDAAPGSHVPTTVEVDGLEHTVHVPC